MIATRKRRFHFPIQRYIKLCVSAIVMYELYSVPLTHKLIFDGPLKPFWLQAAQVDKKFVEPYTGPIVAPLVRPLHFAVQQRRLMERSHEIAVLKASLAGAQADARDNAKKVAALQKQLNSANQQKTGAAAVAATAGAVNSGTPQAPVTPSPDDAQTAQYWAAMEAENAAAIAAKLPPEETARVFAAMKADQVAEIMNALPTDYNVKLKAVRLAGTGPLH